MKCIFLLFLILFPSIVWGDANSNSSQLLIGDINGTNAGRYRSLKFTNGTTTNNNDGSISVTAGGGGTPGGSNPQLQYNNAGAFGGVVASGVDANGNVGIGSVNPIGLFQVVGAGNVGINSTAPGKQLDVQGTVRATYFTFVSGHNIFGTQTDVTASRAVNTVYQNTTGRTMYVQTNWSSSAGVKGATGLSDSSNPPTTTVALANASAGSFPAQVNFMVLNGNYYEVTMTSSSLNAWIEWN